MGFPFPNPRAGPRGKRARPSFCRPGIRTPGNGTCRNLCRAAARAQIRQALPDTVADEDADVRRRLEACKMRLPAVICVRSGISDHAIGVSPTAQGNVVHDRFPLGGRRVRPSCDPGGYHVLSRPECAVPRCPKDSRKPDALAGPARRARSGGAVPRSAPCFQANYELMLSSAGTTVRACASVAAAESAAWTFFHSVGVVTWAI